MVEVIFDEQFKKLFSKVKDSLLREKILKQIYKISINPEIGKPVQFERKGSREVYISPYRLSYIYYKIENKVLIADLYHKDEQ